MLKQLWWNVLKGINQILEAFPDWECKTIGNLHPEGLHCMVCTLWDIRKRVKRAVEFWSDDDRRKRALS